MEIRRAVLYWKSGGQFSLTRPWPLDPHAREATPAPEAFKCLPLTACARSARTLIRTDYHLPLTLFNLFMNVHAIFMGGRGCSPASSLPHGRQVAMSLRRYVAPLNPVGRRCRGAQNFADHSIHASLRSLRCLLFKPLRRVHSGYSVYSVVPFPNSKFKIQNLGPSR